MSHSLTDHVILHLSLIMDVGPAVLERMLARMPASCTLLDIYTFSASDIVQIFGISQVQATKIVQGLADKKRLEDELALIARYSIQWMTSADPGYPTLLKTIIGPPLVLYWRGLPLNEAEKKIAVIGSRKANQYGQKIIDALVPGLVAQEWVIVSGGALGADTMAHQATLKAYGKTVAVLGSGLLQPYPASNKRLFEALIAKGGTLLSTFPLMMEALPGNFPARNRIISGLSKGCVVAQAAKKSGASITAHYALEQGREVFAVPGPVDDELSAGCHALIQEGAKLTTCVEDILHEFGELTFAVRQGTVFDTQPNVPAHPYEATSVQAMIIRLCAHPASVDELLDATGLDMSALNARLFELQLAGFIRQEFNGMWLVGL